VWNPGAVQLFIRLGERRKIYERQTDTPDSENQHLLGEAAKRSNTINHLNPLHHNPVSIVPRARARKINAVGSVVSVERKESDRYKKKEINRL
jgi:hypothetical protein